MQTVIKIDLTGTVTDTLQNLDSHGILMTRNIHCTHLKSF